MTVVVLGCGYTGRRVADLFALRGDTVFATSTHDPSLIHFNALESLEPLNAVPRGCLLLYSLPILDPDPTRAIVAALGDRPSRAVYLSTTGVYGASVDVDEHTPASPNTTEGTARLEAEQAFLDAPFSSIVLRPAAIYGPGRGVHVRMQQGTFKLAGDGSNNVSRIHVEDLAMHVEAALLSDIEGAWPVADESPATSREIAEYCAKLLNVPLPESAPAASLHHTRRANRRVNGGGIRSALGLTLRYPSYREGIPASL